MEGLHKPEDKVHPTVYHFTPQAFVPDGSKVDSSQIGVGHEIK